MTKKRIVVILAILIVLLMTFIGGQAFAKYVGEVKGKGSAEIANWSFKVNNSKEQIQTINLSSTANNASLTNNKLAPGTTGSFNINLDATDSDVGVKYEVIFKNESSKPQNLKFEYDNKTYNSIIELNDKITGTINANSDDKQKNITINWKWEFESGNNNQEKQTNNLKDTQNAKDILKYAFDVSVIGNQIMPNT